MPRCMDCLCEALAGMVGIARIAAPIDVLVSPVAVLIVVLGASLFMLSSGAVCVK